MNTMVGLQASLHTSVGDGIADLMKNNIERNMASAMNTNAPVGRVRGGGDCDDDNDNEDEDDVFASDDFDPAELLTSPLFNNSTDKFNSSGNKFDDSFANENSFGTFEDDAVDSKRGSPTTNSSSGSGEGRPVAMPYLPGRNGYVNEQVMINKRNNMSMGGVAVGGAGDDGGTQQQMQQKQERTYSGDTEPVARSSSRSANMGMTDMSTSMSRRQQENGMMPRRSPSPPPCSADACFMGDFDEDAPMLASPKRIASMKTATPPMTPNEGTDMYNSNNNDMKYSQFLKQQQQQQQQQQGPNQPEQRESQAQNNFVNMQQNDMPYDLLQQQRQRMLRIQQQQLMQQQQQQQEAHFANMQGQELTPQQIQLQRQAILQQRMKMKLQMHQNTNNMNMNNIDQMQQQQQNNLCFEGMSDQQQQVGQQQQNQMQQMRNFQQMQQMQQQQHQQQQLLQQQQQQQQLNLSSHGVGMQSMHRSPQEGPQNSEYGSPADMASFINPMNGQQRMQQMQMQQMRAANQVMSGVGTGDYNNSSNNSHAFRGSMPQQSNSYCSPNGGQQNHQQQQNQEHGPLCSPPPLHSSSSYCSPRSTAPLSNMSNHGNTNSFCAPGQAASNSMSAMQCQTPSIQGVSGRGAGIQSGNPLEQMQQYVQQMQSPSSTAGVVGGGQGPLRPMPALANASLSQTIHGQPFRRSSNPVTLHRMSQSLSQSMHEGGGRRNSYNSGAADGTAPPFAAGMANGSIATEAQPGKGQGPAPLGNAMEKLCESMKRSAMSRSLVKQFSGRGSNLGKQNSFRGVPRQNSAGVPLVKQMSSRGLSRQSSHRSVVDDGSGRGTPTGPAVPIRRISNTKHHLQPGPMRGVYRHDSQQSLGGPSQHGNINLQIDGRNIGPL